MGKGNVFVSFRDSNSCVLRVSSEQTVVSMNSVRNMKRSSLRGISALLVPHMTPTPVPFSLLFKPARSESYCDRFLKRYGLGKSTRSTRYITTRWLNLGDFSCEWLTKLYPVKL